MKRQKDRLHRVVVIGATPAGIAATNKLGELGIPVTLVDSDADLDQKLAKDEWRLETDLPLNYAHRPGLIRIMRNPSIRCILPSEVTSIKHNAQGFKVSMNQQQTFIDAEKCTLCGRCVDICPVNISDTEKAVTIRNRRSLPGRPVIDKRRDPLCQVNCPLGVNAQGYVALTKAGKFHEALQLIKKDNVLPGICGRVCTHPCEQACRRGELDEPVAIRSIKRFLADYECEHPMPAEIFSVPGRSEKIAVIGSGPAGIAAAADLARGGYSVTVFDKEKKAGGLLRYGIGSYRLPRKVLDTELAYIERLGVKFILSHPVSTADIDKLKEDFDAVILTIGSWADRQLGVPGEDLKGVEGGLSFLNRFYRGEIESLKKKVAVIGDGNSAFDLARSLVRLGADVTLLSWFPRDLIPADPDEVREALEEGVTIRDCTQVVEFMGADGRFNKLQCRTTQPGNPDARGIRWPVMVPGAQPFDIEFDLAFVAVGQVGPFKKDASLPAFQTTEYGFISVDENLLTSVDNVYATGDAVTGPSSVVEAMAAGRAVAVKVQEGLTGQPHEFSDPRRPQAKEFPEIPKDIPLLSRAIMPEKQSTARKNNFSEVAIGLSEAQVMAEAERCLQCGVCSQCLQCVGACDAIGAINHCESIQTVIEQAGVVIVADPEQSPSIKGEDVVRAYGPRAAKTDVNAMIIRGFAAAAQAMVLLGQTSQRPKGYGLSFSPPAPALSPDIRIGVFVCRCNDSLGWMDGMTDYVGGLAERSDVIHSEMLVSACVPEGASQILRTIREKGITRVVLASCVCCPLNFVCSACTDQRSRLKKALFTGTGINRSMVETCNLRGEALRLIKKDPDLAMTRFCGLIDRSIKRARKLKALPEPVRNYNFATAVIGESEPTVSSVMTLAETGMDVFWFTKSENSGVDLSRYPSLQIFEHASVKGVSGTLGNFQVIVEQDSYEQAILVGAVIMGEKARKRIRYIHQEGLPSRTVKPSLQKKDVPGVPFGYPGATSIPGLFLEDLQGVHISKRKKGTAAAVMAAAVMPRGPRQSKGFTVSVDKNYCRGCGSCIEACPYQAISLQKNDVGGWYAVVDEALCKGCGNCISVCPSNAADSPYRDQAYLEEMLEEILSL